MEKTYAIVIFASIIWVSRSRLFCLDYMFLFRQGKRNSKNSNMFSSKKEGQKKTLQHFCEGFLKLASTYSCGL